MSLTLNMVGGGGGGLKATDALLRVQAPAGSTVTITKGTVTKTDMGHENADDHTVYDYYFIIHQSQFDRINPWTVTATDGVDTATDTIIIDSADEYDVELIYAIYLYRDGDENTALTGSWKFFNPTSYSQGQGTKNTSDITLYAPSGGRTIAAGTTNKIDLSAISQISAKITTATSGLTAYLLVANNENSSTVSQALAKSQINSNGVITLDVTSISSSAYVCLTLEGSDKTLTFTEVYMK